MLFLGSRTRNTVSGMGLRDRSYTQQVGHSFIICGCLSIVIGLILIIIGAISGEKKTTFIGIGIISLGVGFFLTALVFFCAKLDMCYNNWAYRARVIPINPETPQPLSIGGATASVFGPSSITMQKQQMSMLSSAIPPITVISDVDIHKTAVTSSIKMNNPDNVP